MLAILGPKKPVITAVSKDIIPTAKHTIEKLSFLIADLLMIVNNYILNEIFNSNIGRIKPDGQDNLWLPLANLFIT